MTKFKEDFRRISDIEDQLKIAKKHFVTLNGVTKRDSFLIKFRYYNLTPISETLRYRIYTYFKS